MSENNNENIYDVFKKHQGPVTSLSLHPEDFYKNIDVRKKYYLVF